MQVSTRDKYRRKQKAQEELPSEENEIRVTSRGSASRYIARAGILFLQENFEKIVLKAAGTAISTLCIATEVIRRRIKGLHQINKLENTVIRDEYEPTEEGLDTVVIERKLSVLEIILTKKVTEEEKLLYGYQAPLPEDQVEEMNLDQITKGRAGREDGGRRGEGHERGGWRGERRGYRGGSRGFRGERRSRGGSRRGGGGYRGGNRQFRDEYEHEDDYYQKREYRGGDRRRGGDDREDRREYHHEDRERREYHHEDRERKEYYNEERGERREFRGERRGGRRFVRGDRGGRRGGRGEGRGEGRGGYY